MPEMPASPCTYDCAIDHASGQCRGCHRSLQEITNWFSLTAAQKTAILRRIEQFKSESASPKAPSNKPGEPI